MARVFLARDRVLERDIALKILREQYAENEEFVERFRREALSMSRLSHPNVVQIFDRGETGNGHYYLAMEYVSGGTLKDRIIRDGPLEPHAAAGMTLQIAEALGVAHRNGIIHRDIKPQNILLSESGDVKVADFGIARAAASTAISEASNILGTIRYMSPEQVTGEAITPASDLYSLGVVLYEMLIGQVPFEAETPVAIFVKHLHELPQPPDETDAAIPAGMNALVLKLLAKDPEDRYADAEELISDLRRVISGEDPLALGGRMLAPVASGSVGTHRRKKLTLATVALVGLLGMLSILGWGNFGSSSGGGDIVGTLKGVPDRTLGAIGNVERAVLSSQMEVPDVEGLPSGEASEQLAAADLGAVLRYRESPEEEVGQVLEQSVPGGEEVERGSRILLAVGDGPPESAAAAEVIVPDLLGDSYAEAQTALEEAGMTLGGVSDAPSETVSEGEVVDQNPAPGTSLRAGEPVDLVLSSGPAAPDVSLSEESVNEAPSEAPVSEAPADETPADEAPPGGDSQDGSDAGGVSETDNSGGGGDEVEVSEVTEPDANDVVVPQAEETQVEAPTGQSAPEPEVPAAPPEDSAVAVDDQYAQ